MELKDCYIGQIVFSIEEPSKIGHIVDLDVNSMKGVILVVKWADNALCANNPHAIHPANVMPLK